MKERFRELRKSLKLSQTDFAEKMGVTRSMINNLERGVVEPKEFLVNLACKTYGVNRTWLETGEGEMFCPTADAVLYQLAREYQLDERKMALIRAYLQLPEEQQEAVLAYAEGVADCLKKLDEDAVDDEELRYEKATGAAASRQRDMDGAESAERKA